MASYPEQEANDESYCNNQKQRGDE